ncbi:MAG: hypothetical protein JW795_02530 [Chitinivibrionales bacterium]|nr:hypothetical protein [Chitinivibrionales bacterium]
MEGIENQAVGTHAGESCVNTLNGQQNTSAAVTSSSRHAPGSAGRDKRPGTSQVVRSSEKTVNSQQAAVGYGSRKMMFRMCEVGSTAGECVRNLIEQTVVRSFYFTVSLIGGIIGFFYSFVVNLFIRDHTATRQ